jgi:hypothetical protein
MFLVLMSSMKMMFFSEHDKKNKSGSIWFFNSIDFCFLKWFKNVLGLINNFYRFILYCKSVFTSSWKLSF